MSRDSLHPAVAYHVTNTLGWPNLRPLQLQAVAPLLAGEDVLLIAPTAGGKTEAALLPLLSRMLYENWSPLSVLYLCPLKALINNLADRLQHLTAMLGRSADFWHGDVTAAARRRIRNEPPDMLLTTPESLEVMFVSRAVNHHAFFSNLRAVIVDEIHAFAGDDRGWHLSALLARIEHLVPHRLQRIGLSATVGNPEALLNWLKAEPARKGRVVQPVGEEKQRPDLELDYVGSYQNAAKVIAALHRGEKRLVFVDSRSGVERLAGFLREQGVATYVSHSSLGRDERAGAERAFAESRNCVIVATSTLELGIDVGDLDRVIQIDAPGTVASFLQRLGRTGRRPGTRSNCLFLATSEDRFLLTAGLLQLWGSGFVEPCSPPPLPFHVLAQQILALSLQEDTIQRQTLSSWLACWPVMGIFGQNLGQIIDHLFSNGWLFQDQGCWMVGNRAEKDYGYRAFSALFSVFLSPPIIKIMFGRREIGEVDPANFFGQKHKPILSLGGKGWLVTQIDWDRREGQVRPIAQLGRSLWRGMGAGLHFDLAQACKAFLAGSPLETRQTRRSRVLIEELRRNFTWLERETIFIEPTPDCCRVWAFAGWTASLILVERLKGKGLKAKSDGLVIEVEGTGPQVHRAWIEVLQNADLPKSPPYTQDFARHLKFSECVPEPLLKRCFTQRWDGGPALAELRNQTVVLLADSAPLSKR